MSFMDPPDAGNPASSVTSVSFVTDFPLQALPPTMAEPVQMWAKSLRVPVCMPGCAALAAVSACLGKGLVVLHPVYGQTRGNLYLIVGALSAGGKSASFQVLRPIQQFQAALIEVKNNNLDALETKKAIVDAEISGIKREISKCQFATDDQRKRLNDLHKQRRLLLAEMNQEVATLCEDTTTEKLALALSQNRETMFSASADAGKAIDVLLGRYSRTGQPDDVIYDKAYSGDPCHVSRISRKSISMVSPCLSLFWFLQPIRIDRLFSEKILHEGGFLPRVMICEADAQPTASGCAVNREIEASWHKLLSDLFRTYHQRLDNPLVVKRTIEAREVLEAYREEVEDLRRGVLVDADSFAGRWAEWAWHLSLDLHAAKHGNNAHMERLNSETAKGAVELVRYFAGHQLRLLSKSRKKAAAEKEHAVLRLLSESKRDSNGQAEVTARDLMLARIESKADAAKALLERMVAEGKLASEIRLPAGGRGGHKTAYYRHHSLSDYQQKQSQQS